ncbi:MAG: methylated-DNA--[protein]-cysteine S-methyltransferase [Acidobacteriota bacterium]
MQYRVVPSPIGSLLLAAEAGVVRFLRFANDRRPARPERDWEPDDETLAAAEGELRAYFAGTLRRFSVPLEPQGTPFQARVWHQLRQIPYGTTISYQDLADRVGNRKAVRAVGLANGANPIPIMIPCHRVIGSNGSLVGYGGGLPVKRSLIALERGEQTLPAWED